MGETPIASQRYLDWHDIADMFHCGRNKAMLIMHAVGVIYIGERAFIRESDLDAQLEENGEIKITW